MLDLGLILMVLGVLLALPIFWIVGMVLVDGRRAPLGRRFSPRRRRNSASLLLSVSVRSPRDHRSADWSMPGDDRPGYPSGPAQPGADGTRRSTPQPQGHALGGEGHLRAHGRPGLRRPVLRRRADGQRGPGARGAALEDLAHAMREVCVLAARSPRDAEEMSSVLHVLSAIERMGNAARRHRAHRHPPARASPPRWSPTSPRPRRSRTACGCGPSRCSRTARSPTCGSPPRSACASSPSGAARSG